MKVVRRIEGSAAGTGHPSARAGGGPMQGPAGARRPNLPLVSLVLTLPRCAVCGGAPGQVGEAAAVRYRPSDLVPHEPLGGWWRLLRGGPRAWGRYLRAERCYFQDVRRRG